MNREIRAPKGEISPFPQASWRRNHDNIESAPRKRTGHAPSAFPRVRSEDRVSSKEFASGQTSRLFYGSCVFKAASAFQKGACVQSYASARQFNSTLAPTDNQLLPAKNAPVTD